MRLLIGRGVAFHPSALRRPVLALAPPRRPWWRSPSALCRPVFAPAPPRQSWWRSRSALRRPVLALALLRRRGRGGTLRLLCVALPVLALLAPLRRPALAVGRPAFASSDAGARSCAASSAALAISLPVSASMIIGVSLLCRSVLVYPVSRSARLRLDGWRSHLCRVGPRRTWPSVFCPL